MQTDNGQSVSIWMATADMPVYPPLASSMQTGVCVIGAGIAGLSTAYHLANAGVQVIVLDDGPVGDGESARTTAHLTCILDKGYAETQSLRGTTGARLAAESYSAAIDMIERIVTSEGIDCDFQRFDGYLFLTLDDRIDTLTEEMEAAQQAGLLGVEMVRQVPWRGFDTGPALRFPRQGHFHVLKYLAGLSRAIEQKGGKIFTGTHVTAVKGGPTVRIETQSGLIVTANAAVLATNAPINDVLGLSTKQFPYKTYVIGMRIPRGDVPAGIYYDTEEPYHYVRIQPEGEGDILIVGGEDHKTGQADDIEERYNRLEAWTRARFPSAGEVVYRWSGQVMNSADGLAFIGPDLVDKNVYIITGDTGMGMTHGTIGGMLVSDLILRRPNGWAELYDPARVPLGIAPAIISEGANVVTQLSGWVTGGDVATEREIMPGSGAVVGWGLKKMAVYRDEQGVYHRSTATCSHLGCIVAWNAAEKTWDCPCHGSRYNPYGKVINGPAATDLERVGE